MGMAVTSHIPTTEGMSEVEKTSFVKSMQLYGLSAGRVFAGQED